MKNYQIKKQVEKDESGKKFTIVPFVTDLVKVKDKEGNTVSLDVILEDGESFRVAYTSENLKKFRDVMLQQAKNSKQLLPKKKAFGIVCKIITFAGATGFVILNTSEIGKEITPIINGNAAGAIALVSGVGVMVNNYKMNDIQKNVIFAYHKDEINKYVANNPYVYENVDKKDKEKIMSWIDMYGEEPIVIENLDQLSPSTISTIWKNIKLNKQFKIDCNIEEQGFQKTLEQV